MTSLRSSLATPEGKRWYVRRLFATIADRYDFITVVLSYGQDRRWKRRLAAMAAVRPGEKGLDLASGTGDIAFELAHRGARMVGLDITHRMAQIAQAKSQPTSRAATDPSFVVGDMMALPFPRSSFELVTTGYGIRNVPDIAGALSEIFRVLRPGGRIISLDFDRPEHPLVRWAYLLYLTAVGSALGFALHRDPNTYRYIPESIRSYPGANALCRLMRAEGFVDVEHLPVLGGLMAIHMGKKVEPRT